MLNLPSGQFACVFEIANDRSHWQAPRVQDPAEFVIGANIRRRHLTKEAQAELIVQTIAAGKIDCAAVARSFNPTSGKKGGSTKDPVLEQAVTEAKKHGISKRTVQVARAKLQGKSTAKPTRPKQAPLLPTPAPTAVEPRKRSLPTPGLMPLDDIPRFVELFFTEIDALMSNERHIWQAVSPTEVDTMRDTMRAVIRDVYRRMQATLATITQNRLHLEPRKPKTA